MKLVLILFTLILLKISFQSFAGSGVVNVLEAPLFSKPNKKAKILQYKRKGDKLYIHNEEFSNDEFAEYFETDSKELIKSNDQYHKDYPDQLFKKEYPKRYKNFYKTLTRSGREAYILKEHIFIYYNDARELTQILPKVDPTDYRIEEPLPKDYPLKGITGYRGQLLISLGTPTDQPYPYAQKINDTAFDFNKEFSFVWVKQVSFDTSKRFFFGGELNIMSGKSEYLTDDISAIESQLQIGIGPYLSYDVWRKDRHVLNIHGSLVLNFYDVKDIKQNFLNTTSANGTTSYNSIYFSPKIALSYHYKKFLGPLDLISGIKANMHAPHTYKATSDIDTNIWVQEYQVGYSFEQSYYLGIQTAY